MKVNYVVKRGPELPEARWDLRAAGGVVQAAGPSVPRAHRPVGPRSCSPSAVMPDMTGKRRVEPPPSRLPPWGTAVTPVSRPAWGPLPPPEPPGSWNGPGWLTHAEWPWLSRCREPSAFFPRAPCGASRKAARGAFSPRAPCGASRKAARVEDAPRIPCAGRRDPHAEDRGAGEPQPLGTKARLGAAHREVSEHLLCSQMRSGCCRGEKEHKKALSPLRRVVGKTSWQ